MFPLNPRAEAAPGQLKSATSMAQSGCKVKRRYACTAQTPRWEVGMKNEQYSNWRNNTLGKESHQRF